VSGAKGWRPDTPDHRDSIFNLKFSVRQAHELAPAGGVAASELPPIWNQLSLGSCTAHGSLRGFLAWAIQEGLSLPMLSRLMQYFDARRLEGSTAYDAGAQVRDAIKALAQFGCAPESEWPYDIASFAEEPPAGCYTDAKKHVAFSYHRILPNAGGAPMRTALAQKKAIVFGFMVPASFEDGTWDPSSGQPLPLPSASEGFIGAHCVAATAYDFSCKFASGAAGSYRMPPFFTCDNSWGVPWGMGGRFNLDARWFGGLATDLWVFDRVS
jgi:C1A family cysteine protease